MARDVRLALAAQAARARERFLDCIGEDKAASTQDETLKQCVAPNAQTEFGREHRFEDIRDIDAYRERVPVREYEQLRPWVDRAAEGAPSVLTAEAPLRFWKTTGTTSRPKRIPVTQTASARVTESWFVVSATQMHYYPELNERADTILLTHISPKSLKETVPSGVPYCSTTEAPLEVRRGQEPFIAPWFLRLQSVVEDDAERLYFLVCYAALHDLFAIGCLHPSRFQTIVATLDRHRTRLLQELAEGTVLGERIRDPRPDRARELHAIADKTGTLLPHDVWPSLRFLTSWSGSYIDRHLPLMERAFCKDFIPMPSVSSECFMTTTIDKDPLGQPLNLRGGLFEFIPTGAEIRPTMRTRLFHEVEQNQRYEIVISTFGGLYRYAIGDIFRVTGFVGGVPRLEYVGRRGVTDMTGEKLAYEQAVEVVTTTLAPFGDEVSNFAVCAMQPGPSNPVPHYVLVIEAGGAWAHDELERVGSVLDEGLKAANSRYELKRNFRDLGGARLEVVSRGTFVKYRELLVSRGMPAGQLKDKMVYDPGAPVLEDLLRIHRELSA